MKNLYISLTLFLSLLLASCVQDSDLVVMPDSELPINISAVYPVADTRVDANGFVRGDEVGVFIVDYDSNGNPGNLAMSGVRAANTLFELIGTKWVAGYQLYWANGTTPADFYGYYPYDMNMDNPTQYLFSVQSKQLSKTENSTAGSGYEMSDFLWAKTEKVYPTTNSVKLTYKHLMAGVNISLERGDGFSANEWSTLEKTVVVGKTHLMGMIDISRGSVDVVEEEKSYITPLLYEGSWRAVVIPQTVYAGDCLVHISVDGQSYEFVKDEDMTFRGGKMHNFTIKVNRRADSGDYEFVPMPDSIVAWVDDPDFHDGIVREYIVVDTGAGGKLQQSLDMLGYEYSQISALKVTGYLNHDDFTFIGDNLISLKALNIRDVYIPGNVYSRNILSGIGGRNVKTLDYIVLPAGLKKIDNNALEGVGLVGGVDIPEGVEEIGHCAFANNHLTGEIKLPSTLKVLQGGAFMGNKGIYGQLYLPEGLVTVGKDAFSNTRLSGPLILPSTLEEYENMGFTGTMGSIIVPPKITTISESAFANSGCSKVVFHDAIEEIGRGAFYKAAISGELVLPPNLKVIRGNAFNSTRITRIVFPESLKILDDGHIFANCEFLMGVIELPNTVHRIPIGLFENCRNISGIVIPENIDVIDKMAFRGCSAIQSIVCHATTPPALGEDVFVGVDRGSVIVEVPIGCLNDYKLAPGWSEFKRITEHSNFVCRPAQVNALNNPHNEVIVLNASGPWEVIECPEWIELNKRSGSGKSEINLIFRELPHGAGDRIGVVKFLMPNEGYETSIDVIQYDYEYEEDSCRTVQEHTLGNGGMHLVFMGDGYDGEAISNGSYLNLVEQQIEYFFDIEPYKSLRDYFDVHILFPLSQEKGINTMHTYVNNRFGTFYGKYDGDKCAADMLLAASDEIIDYAMTYVEELNNYESLIVLVPNDDSYDGNTILGYPTISICPPSNRPYPQDTRGVVQHEACGHGFGKLADENVVEFEWPKNTVKDKIMVYQSIGWYQNISLDSKYNSVPWADFIFDPNYSDRVDIFEGACGYMRGVFRSEQNSCMNYGIPYFNTISRKDICKRILTYGGKNFTMDYFYANDTFEWGSTGNATRALEVDCNAYASSNTHVSPIMVDPKRLGDMVRSIRANLKNNKN